MTKARFTTSSLLCAAFLSFASPASALERICDVAFENCRNPLISLIRAENVGIDVAFWFMEDQGLAQELINRFNAGVPVRVLVDTRSIAEYPDAAAPLRMLRDAKIPIRRKSGLYGHWKMMLFAGQETVQFSGANYSREAFMFGTPYSDYVDEVIYFTDHTPYVNSFKTMYDNAWMTTSAYVNYANVPATRTRVYPTYENDPEMNFVPSESFRTRSVARYRAETTRIDVHMYRITDKAHADEMIRAARDRHVPVRLFTEPTQYRDPNRLWHAFNVDRMYVAGVEIRHRAHKGLSHEKLTYLASQGMSIFGSSNWTEGSSDSQWEHNLFTTDPVWAAWTQNHFNRKWNNTGPAVESKPFTPLAGDVARVRAPANGASEQPTSLALTWWGGPWNHRYDVYLGTSPTAMAKVLNDRELGPSESSTDVQKYTVSGLAGATTYYWKVVSRTRANMETTSPTFSFTTTGSGPAPPLPSGWSDRDIGSVAAFGSASFSGSTYTVRGSGADIWGTADEFHFAYRTMSGNGTITARVGSISTQHAWVKGGVMIRETLAANSKHATMFASNTKGLAFQRRPTTGGDTTHTAGAAAQAPYWIRLTRSGNTFSAYSSPDGTTWTLVGTQSISMTSSVYVGLAVTSHSDGNLGTVTFSNVTTP